MTSTTNQYGELATQLVTESRRSTLTDNLLKYNDPLVRSIVREQRQLEQSIANALAESSQLDEENAKLDGEDPHTPALLIFQTAIERNKRCLLAYHQHRLDRLRDMYWSAGGSLPHLLSSADTRAKLSPHEVDFLKAYNASVMDFRGAFSDELDITANIMSVPKDLHVLVRVVKDCGVIQTELGAIDFKRGQRFMVRRADIEHLIVQGYLEEV
ncbi:GINS complex Psf1 component [Punctularia strigosozonata HHB-11173 SS5]|uniref:GINS complex Psf1 component n=1 Tax=Punctularia strigosozonata (strain HHB-11173) TaxID=741275 RepID=UPI0004416BC3|nr:GINS complex Psf1 component [Punctularia strigosozonata HHB-11173 SS5]EIN10013.1 GINS complex Psf1 component [Punctularia strigosozonata HHB-11173 SS5]